MHFIDFIRFQEKFSARVGYHCEQVLGLRSGEVKYNIKSKIAETFCRTHNKYVSRIHPLIKHDFEIILDKDFELKEGSKILTNLQSKNIPEEAKNSKTIIFWTIVGVILLYIGYIKSC